MSAEGIGQPSGSSLPVPAAEQQTLQDRPHKKTYRKIELPTPEQLAQEEFMNNCATRTVLAGGYAGPKRMATETQRHDTSLYF